MVNTYFDSATIYYRAFYAVPEKVTAPDGTPSGAVRGFLDMVSTLLVQFPATNVAFAWDDDWRPQWRVDLIDSYKTHRLEDSDGSDTSIEVVPDNLSPQITAIAQILDAIGVARIGDVGHEADDVLGALVARSAGQTHVVTGDRDLFQLVNDKKKVRVVSITKGVKNLEVVDDAYLVERYGIKGSQYADFSALRGDPSDGLPGVKGIGEKTATSLITKYGSLAKVIAAAGDPASDMSAKLRTSIVAHHDYLFAAAQVVTVRTDAALPDHWHAPATVKDPHALAQLVSDWGVEKQCGRIVSALGINA